MTRADKMREEIVALGDLPRFELADRWTAIYGAPPPPGARRVLLERAIAWHLQAKTGSGLSKEVRRRLDRLVSLGRGHSVGVAQTGLGDASAKPSPQRKHLDPGTRLVREWHGRTHTVEVTVTGYVWNGETYRSLSEIARLITGTRWSGPRFFGT
jgi:hypothetical protein